MTIEFDVRIEQVAVGIHHVMLGNAVIEDDLTLSDAREIATGLRIGIAQMLRGETFPVECLWDDWGSDESI